MHNPPTPLESSYTIVASRAATSAKARSYILGASIASLLAVSGTMQAATFKKADNTNNLNLTTSWLAGAVPTASDIALWDNTVTGANSVSLGADLSWQGLAMTNPGGAVTIGSGNTLTLGTSGIDMTAATQNLTISSNLTIGPAQQVWNVASGTTLTLNTGTFARSAGSTLNIQGAGTVASSMAGLSTGDASTPLQSGASIVGPWLTVGTGSSTRYGVVVGGNIVGYTSATPMSTAASAWAGIPSGGTGTINYDITVAGTPGATGLGRNVNTLRYSGNGAFTQTSNTSSILLTTNGILNAGTGLFTVGTGAQSLNVAIGTKNELVLHAANAGILIDDIISGAAGARVTVVGPNTVQFNGSNTYTGGTFVNSGKLVATAGGMNGGPINIASGATLTFTGNNQTSTSAVSGSGAIVNDTANTILFTGNHSGFSGTFMQNAATNNTQFNSATSASQNASYSLNAGELILAGAGDYTVTMGSLASAAGQTIRGGNSATGTTTLQVGNLGTNTTIAGFLNNGTTKVIALTKVGNGTLTLIGANTYTGPTLISAGTLAVSGSGSINSSSAITINGSGAKLLHASSVAGAPAITLAQGTLDGSGTIGTVTVANNASNIVTHGNGGAMGLTLSALTFAGAATANFNILGAPGLAITGALTTTPTSGSVTINGSGAWANGLNDLMSFGSFSGSISDFTKGTFTGLSGRQTADSLQLNANSIALNVIGDNPLWTGANGGVWQQFAQGSATSANPAWKLQTGGTPTDFWVADNAVFDDSATGTTTATIHGGNVSPNSITFNHSAIDYTITTDDGSGIATGLLIKNGTGNLTINTANAFAGGTTINAGKIAVGTATALGAGSVTLNGGDLDIGGQSMANAVVLTTGVVLGNGTLSGDISGAGALSRSAGTVTLSGTNTYSGGTTLNDGILNINSASALGTGLVTINGGTIDNTSGSAKALTTNNAQNWNGDFAFAGTANLDMGSGTVMLGGGGDRTVTVTAGSLGVGELKSTTVEGLIKQGAGTFVVNSTGAGVASSVLGGTLNVVAGTLQINKAGTSGPGSGDFSAAGLVGTGTILNGANDERWLFINSTGNDIFTGTLADGGTGTLGLNKQGTGTLTLSGTNSHTGTTTVGGGMLVVTSVLSNTPINVNGGTLSLEVANAFAPTAARTVTVSGAGELVQTVDNAIGGLASLVAQKSLTLSHPNSYSGDTTINAGTGTTVTITDAAAAGTGRFNAATGATNPVFNLHINGGGTIAMANSFGGNSGVTTTIDVDNNGSGSNGVIQLNGSGLWGNGTLNVTGNNGYRLEVAGFTNNAGGAGTTVLNPTTANVSVGTYSSTTNSAKVLKLDGTSSSNSVTGTISNGTNIVSVTKANTSTWTLSGANTYTGATTISGGTLLVQGSITASSAVNITAGTLGGAGSISSPITVGDGLGTHDAIISPGLSIGTLGNTGGVIFQADAAFTLEINTDTMATDLLASTGAISLGVETSTLNITNLGSTVISNGETFTFITGDSGVTGAFAGLQDGTILQLGENAFEINYTSTSVQLIAVPEPANAALLLGSAVLLGLRRARRRLR